MLSEDVLEAIGHSSSKNDIAKSAKLKPAEAAIKNKKNSIKKPHNDETLFLIVEGL